MEVKEEAAETEPFNKVILGISGVYVVGVGGGGYPPQGLSRARGRGGILYRASPERGEGEGGKRTSVKRPNTEYSHAFRDHKKSINVFNNSTSINSNGIIYPLYLESLFQIIIAGFPYSVILSIYLP